LWPMGELPVANVAGPLFNQLALPISIIANPNSKQTLENVFAPTSTYMVPVQNAGQQLYLNPSTQHSPGGNIIQLPSMVPAGYSPGHAVSALPPQYVVAQHTGGQPMGYFPNTPIVPVQALPQVQYVQAQTQPQVHYALAPSNSPLTVWDVELPPTTVRAANPTYPILPHLSAVLFSISCSLANGHSTPL
ncbi:5602_t:CDS:2, partial [Acaulospora colombiana]